MSATNDRVTVENVLQPGKTYTLDAHKYRAMRRAMLASLPKSTPGLTVAELKQRILPRLPQDLFPGGDKAGWWLKAVQLDLEAKRLVARAAIGPVRLHRSD